MKLYPSYVHGYFASILNFCRGFTFYRHLNMKSFIQLAWTYSHFYLGLAGTDMLTNPLSFLLQAFITIQCPLCLLAHSISYTASLRLSQRLPFPPTHSCVSNSSSTKWPSSLSNVPSANRMVLRPATNMLNF